MPIKMLFARQVLDPLGVPTVEVDLVTELGLFRAAAPPAPPARARVGGPVALRDGLSEYLGQGVAAAVARVNTVIAPELLRLGLEPTAQRELDQFMLKLDGSDDRSKLGANAMLAVSLAAAEAGAAKRGLPLYRHMSDLAGVVNMVLPVPQITVLAGGARAANGLPYREYMVMPTGATTFAEAVRIGAEIYGTVKNVVRTKYGVDRVYVGDSGGLAPPLLSHRDAMLMLTNAIAQSGHKGNVEIALDAGASDFYKDSAYDLQFRSPHSNPRNYLTADRLAEEYLTDVKDFGVCSVEDPFEGDDWAAWSKLAGATTCQVLAGNLTRTNLERVHSAAERKACTAVSLLLGEYATVWELVEMARAVRAAGLGLAVCGQGAAAADLTVGLGAGLLRVGAPVRGERTATYNHMLRIEEELGALVKYAGRSYRAPAV